MKKYLVLLLMTFTGLFCLLTSGSAEKVHVMTSPGIQTQGTVKTDLNFGTFPLYFVFNKGQVNQKAAFYAKTSRYTLWLTKEGLVFDSLKKVEGKTLRDVSRLIFLNAHKNPGMAAVKPAKLKVNHFKGNDQTKWYRDIPTSSAVLYKTLYKHIDLKVYGIEKQVEYDWIVKPGGNPGDIEFRYTSVKQTRIDHQGNLSIETDFGELIHKRPVSYQEIGGKRLEVKATFKKIAENTYGFEVGAYDKQYELIIDPIVLLYSTYLGSGGNEYGSGIAVDGKGYVYVTGWTDNADFPTRDHYLPFQGDVDTIIMKIDTTQTGDSSLIYSTCLGGTGEDKARGIAVDDNGCVYMTGDTDSVDFPTVNPYQTDQGYTDAFVIKIDTTQSGTAGLIYSTYLGSESHDTGSGIAVDGSGNVYVTGTTTGLNFPTLNPYQTYQGSNDVFVTKIDTTRTGTASLIFSTYLGDWKDDDASAIAVNSNGHAYITGYTVSSNFPTRNQYQSQQGYFENAFITKIDTTLGGTECLLYSTYLGGSGPDYGKGIAVDAGGCAYVTGRASSLDFPTRNAYLSSVLTGGVFVAKIDTTKSGGSSFIYSTYLGGSGYGSGNGIAVDGAGCAYVTGYTYSENFPILDPYQTDQPGTDVFVAKIDTGQFGASSLIYSTYLGGASDDHGYGIAVDADGRAYIVGTTVSPDFPARNPYQAHQGNSDIFVTKLIPATEAPYIELNRTHLNFGVVIGGPPANPQTVAVNNTGGGTMNWTAASDKSWIQTDPAGGTGPGTVTVSVDTTGLPAGVHTGTVSITDPSAYNSPQSVSVTLTICRSNATSAPFGTFSTPVDGSTVQSSIPVTGWVLDDIQVERVEIYRDEGVYIGDALFVDGARPDVEAAYPGYPFNYRAGWGYMLLTNFLPNGGNGTFTIYARAADREGNVVTLGTKTITCDNANAVNPFGAVDTPTQGGTVSGSDYKNIGWVLTPSPNEIPGDGSTIWVFVDGIRLGNPVYNIYREDIARLFPGYANSDGANGYFNLDTTTYANGVHIIYWTAEDDAGNTDGIGSRYFTIQNPAGSMGHGTAGGQGERLSQFGIMLREQENSRAVLRGTPRRVEQVDVIKGFNGNATPQRFYPDENGDITVDIKELERVEIHFPGSMEALSPLPIGSSLDREKGIFYWAAGPGFFGEYWFHFGRRSANSETIANRIKIVIQPKFK